MAEYSNKIRVLFVGAFPQTNTGNVSGGLMYACSTLIKSRLSQKIEWIKIDSTARTNYHRSIAERTFGAIMRLLLFVYYLAAKRPSTVLIFTSHGFSFYEKGCMVRIAKRVGCKVILAPRSGIIKNNVVDSKRFTRFLTDVLSKTDVLICQGVSWREFYSKFVNSSEAPHFAVIPNWINLDKYPARPIKERTSDSIFKVVFVGWITANKGVYDLLAAAKLLENEQVEFLLAGDGDAMTELQQRLTHDRTITNFKLLGWKDHKEKMQLLNASGAFVLPSYREGYPNALLEAMSTRLPVIASRVGAIPDLVTDGVNGLLIDPNSPKQIAEAIMRIKESAVVAARLANAARHTIETNNDLERAIKHFETILLD